MSALNRLTHLSRAMGTTASRASTSSPHTTSAKALRLVDSAIEENFITVFSKTYCAYCRRAKNLISTLELPEGKTVKIYELDERDDGPAIQTALFERTGQSTVPSVFINKEHIGGSDELAAAERSGKLRKILAAAAKHT